MRSSAPATPSPGTSPVPPSELLGGEPTPVLPPLLRRVWFGLNQAFRRRLVSLGLTPDQYTVLRNLAEAGKDGLTQRELGDRMTSDPNTITALIERMAGEKWLIREPDTRDRRAKRVRLAPAGAAKFAAARQAAARLHDEVTGGFSTAEHRQLLHLLHRLAQACQSALARSRD